MIRQDYLPLKIVAFFALSLAPLKGMSQDPSNTPIPDLAEVIGDTRHTLVVEALLASDGSVIDFDAAISLVPPRTNIGNPPLILLETFDAQSNLLITMNAWDPRWEFQETEEGGEQMEIQPEGLGEFVIPFDPAIASVRITDLQTETAQELITIDVADVVQGFCIANPGDPECVQVNQPPTANTDNYATDEDTELVVGAPGVLDNDADENPAALQVTGNTNPSHGSVAVSADGSFTYAPDLNYFGADGFTYTVTDEFGETDTGTVNVTVNPINDAPQIVVSRDSAELQYSDEIGTVEFTATDVDDATLAPSVEWTDDGGTSTNADLPSSLSTSPALGSPACVAESFDSSPVPGSTCHWTVSGAFGESAGTYDLLFKVTDAGDAMATGQTRLVVSAEDAAVSLDDGNPVSVQVAEDGGDSGLFTIVLSVQEWQPDEAIFTPQAGDISLAQPNLQLTPVGPGSPVSPIAPCNVVSNGLSGYDEILTIECDFDAVPVNTYGVDADISGGYYTGLDEDVLTVFDPSLGFTTGSGWFYWPGTDDKTNFGYTMKYNKNHTNIRGSFLLIRHIDGAPEGEDKWRVKSNALEGLALGAEADFSWAVFTGKATFKAPGVDTEGNHSFTVYVEDRGEPGAGADRLWLETMDKDNAVIEDLSLGDPAASNAVTLDGGNIVVPHSGQGGG